MDKIESLEAWMDTIEALPNELQRNYSQIREMDAGAQQFVRAIEADCRRFLGGDQLSLADKKILLQQLNRNFQSAIQQSEEKVSLAVQTYDLVDKHIRRLDQDLARFEDELTITGVGMPEVLTLADKNLQQQQQQQQGRKKTRGGQSVQQQQQVQQQGVKKQRRDSVAESVDQQPSRKPPRDRSAAVTRLELPGNKNQNTNINNLTSAGSGGAGSRRPSNAPRAMFEDVSFSSKPGPDTPIDPNEPTYCICNQVSYGAMVGCDNEDCEVEWFHIECVGLNVLPQGKWYCAECDRKMKLQ